MQKEEHTDLEGDEKEHGMSSDHGIQSNGICEMMGRGELSEEWPPSSFQLQARRILGNGGPTAEVAQPLLLLSSVQSLSDRAVSLWVLLPRWPPS